MTIYFSENPLQNEIISSLKKFHPRGKICSNSIEIERADTIDYNLLLNYFDCAVAKQKDLYTAAITLPENLEHRIPFWFIQEKGEVWIDPKSGPKGKNVYSQSLFTVKFNMYINEANINNFPRSEIMPTDQALIEEFVSIRNALQEGNEEPIDVFRSFYGTQSGKEIKSYTARYLASILDQPHS